MSEENILAGDEAFALQQQGKEAWNAWVEKHPEARISFSGFEFGRKRSSGENLSFEGFKFPNGEVSFLNATFGDGGVDFSGAAFGDGGVDFNRAAFGKGDVDFRDTTFGKGAIGFINATFGDGGVDFNRAAFGKGGVDFRRASFGDGKVDFRHANFGSGGVDFRDANFGKKAVFFSGVTFGDGGVDFRGVTFGGPVVFENLKNSEKISSLDFHGAHFKGTLVLEGEFHTVPDLRRTKADYHLDLSGVTIAKDFFKSKNNSPDEGKKNAARLRRLREISENNRHHDAGLHFFERENQVMRASGEWKRLRVYLDHLYELTSRYGQKILRPFGWLCVLTLAFFFVYGGWDALSAAVSSLCSFFFVSGSQAGDAFSANLDVWDVVKAVQITLTLVFAVLMALVALGFLGCFVSGLAKLAKKCEKFRGRRLAFIHRQTKKYSRGLGWLAVVFLLFTAFFLLLYCVANVENAENAFILALSNAIPFILSSKPQATDAFKAIFGCEASNVPILTLSNATPFIPSSTEQVAGASGCEPPAIGVFLTSLQKLLSFIFLFLIGLGLRNRFRF